MTTIFDSTPRVLEFMQDLMPSATHRRMYHLGLVTTKLSLMYPLLEGERVPEECSLSVILLLDALESGDNETYMQAHERVNELYHQHLANREVQ